ncbi:MAG: hypothetical protein ING44_12860 [Telmatospirillum sp.]|nr:hypothetical protein [Telmatospirillum sp.]
MTNILGIHGGVSLSQHDAGAALICDGRLVACIEEERLARVKSAPGYIPIGAIEACLAEGGLRIEDIDLVVHPGATYEDMPVRIQHYLKHYFGHAPKIEMINHQVAHLSSAFYHSGFERAMCLSYDAYGDRLSAALAFADREGIKVLETRDSDNSLGTFYQIITSYLGFMPREDEYKIMGLAAYGRPKYDLSSFLRATPSGYQLERGFLREEPVIRSPSEPFYTQKLVDLLGEPRRFNAPLVQRHADIAFAAQAALEECASALVKHLHSMTQSDALCVAGGIGLNCSANLALRRLPFIKKMFVQPAASDRGLALGCALYAANQEGNKTEPLAHPYYGPTRTNDQILAALRLTGHEIVEVADPAAEAARQIEQGCIVGWFEGRSEFGPRALGHRSILGDPRSADMKEEINARVKYREEFRPFAPAVLGTRYKEIFDLAEPSPYMTMAVTVKPGWGEKLKATTHVNNTARVQTVDADVAPNYFSLIENFEKLTGVPVVLNTSFNIKGQPIVETPLEALSTFSATGMDTLFMGPFMVRKNTKPRAGKFRGTSFDGSAPKA